MRDYVPGPSVCDPWLMVCEAGPVPVSKILGSRSSTDLGWTLGVGVEVSFWEGGRSRFFLEARWRYVRGPEYALPGEAQRGSGHYFPLRSASPRSEAASGPERIRAPHRGDAAAGIVARPAALRCVIRALLSAPGGREWRLWPRFEAGTVFVVTSSGET
ncbi:MAG: hypothetical protein M0C28_36890 [Candidatus Moduliflexus flocculans]|nr:hypothetical protein [Candidatus Moduliflexus flocculans]